MAKKNPSKNKRTAIILGLAVVGLVLGSFASVPLYRIFCQVTGFGGTTQRAEQGDLEDKEYAEVMDIFFDNTIARGAPIKVEKLTPNMEVKLNQSNRGVFRITNKSDDAITISSTYNATPLKYAYYINKIDCFCFEEQLLKPHEVKDFSTVFFISPHIMEAEGGDRVKELTLGFHFFLVADNSNHQTNDNNNNH